MLALILYFMGVSRINNFYLVVISLSCVFIFCRFCALSSTDFFPFWAVQNALCTTSLKFITSNTRFHTSTRALFSSSFHALYCMTLNIYSKLHFVWTRCRHFSSLDFDFLPLSFFERIMLRREIYAIKKIDTWCFDVFHY